MSHRNTQQQANPYASPQDRSVAAPSFRPLTVTLARRSWLYRRFQIHAQTDVTLEYNGRSLGSESVWIDGVQVATGSGLVNLASPIHFDLHVDGRMHEAFFEIDTRLMLFIAGLRLVVDDLVVYRE